ncbi:hypothetical protein PIB30_041974, partial [Stylosanthes scabra]|nr:hypothetical protein [Stylosanthes scabra]
IKHQETHPGAWNTTFEPYLDVAQMWSSNKSKTSKQLTLESHASCLGSKHGPNVVHLKHHQAHPSHQAHHIWTTPRCCPNVVLTQSPSSKCGLKQASITHVQAPPRRGLDVTPLWCILKHHV